MQTGLKRHICHFETAQED